MGVGITYSGAASVNSVPRNNVASQLMNTNNA